VLLTQSLSAPAVSVEHVTVQALLAEPRLSRRQLACRLYRLEDLAVRLEQVTLVQTSAAADQEAKLAVDILIGQAE
jgi:hypothetical protein